MNRRLILGLIVLIAVSTLSFASAADISTNSLENYTLSLDDDAVFIGTQHLATIGIFVLTSLCHEDGIIITLTKYKGGENDVDHIKMDVQQRHDA